MFAPPRPFTRAVPALAVLAALIALAWFDLWAADIWWQLATGRWIVEHGAVPRADPFSWTTSGIAWIEPRWGHEALAYLAYRAGGSTALVAAKAALLAVAFGLAASAVRCRRAPALGWFVVGLAVVASSDRFVVRPELWTFLFLAATILCLERARAPGRRAWLVGPVVAAGLWANLHSTALVGPGVVALHAVGVAIDRARQRRAAGRTRIARPAPFALAALGAGLALLANPYGPASSYELPLRLLSQIREGHVYEARIVEFAPPWATAGWHLTAYWTLLGGTGLVALATARRQPAARLLILAVFAALSLEAARNIPLLALVAIPVAAGGIDRLARRRRVVRLDLWVGRLLPLAAAVLAFWVATDRWAVGQGSTRRFGSGVSALQAPAGALDFLDRHPPPGRGFASLADASHLIWSGRPVFTDGRLELHDVATFETFLDVARGRIDPDQGPGLEGVRWALVDHDALQPVVVRLEAEGSAWRAVYVDATRVVYVRQGEATATYLDDLARRYPSLPVLDVEAARADRPSSFLRARAPIRSRRLGAYFYRAGRSQRAIEFLERADAIEPLDPRHRLFLGQAYLDPAAAGGPDLERAEAAFERVAREAPGSPEPHRWLGLVAWLRRRDRAAAIDHLRRYVRLGGSDPAVLEQLRTLEASD